MSYITRREPKAIFNSMIVDWYLYLNFIDIYRKRRIFLPSIYRATCIFLHRSSHKYRELEIGQQNKYLKTVLRTVSRTSIGTDQNFIIGCRYFLKKWKLPVRTKILLFVAGVFLVAIFLFLCEILVIYLSTYRVMA